MLSPDPTHAALVLIDLQQGIAGFARAPHDAAQVLANAAALVRHFRDRGSLVVRVKVGWHAGHPDLLAQRTDQAAPLPPGGLPADWWDDPAGLASAPQDLQIVKRQWNAFHGTELDLQLRRRGVRQLVLGGIVTHIGVEGTARAAWERGYELVVVEDACSAPLAEPHRASMQYVMPRLARVRSTAQVLAGVDNTD